MPVIVYSRGSAGETYEIALDQTGSETGRIAIRSWKPRRPRSAPPDSADVYNLTHVRAKDAGTLVCKADLPFVPDVFDPVVICRLDPNKGETPLVRIEVAGKSYAYPLVPADFQSLASFIQAAGFPHA